MAQPDYIRKLALIAARDHMEGIDFLSVVETAEADELDMNENDMRAAHRLAQKARVVISDD